MAKQKSLGKLFLPLNSFFIGFFFVMLLMIFISGAILVKNIENKKSIVPEVSLNSEKLVSYDGADFTLSYPDNYQLSENKIIATDGIVVDQENTIHLISTPLNEKGENLSLIITYIPLDKYQEKKNESTTCPELYSKKLQPINIGEKTFTTSGQIICGPSEVAFFYILNDGLIYEIKVETTADYESEAVPEILKILKTLKFKEK